MIRSMLRRWRNRRRLPAVMRHGTPREGGRGTIAPRDDLYPFSGHIERTAALGCGPVTSRPEVVVIETMDTTGKRWRAMQAAQRPRETMEEAMQRRNALGAQAELWNWRAP